MADPDKNSPTAPAARVPTPAAPTPAASVAASNVATADAAATTAAAVEDAKNRATREIDDRQKAMERSNAEAMRRMDSAKPTPTQRENDLAKMGVAVLDKEDHGAEPEDVAIRRQMEARLAPQPYATRDLNERK